MASIRNQLSVIPASVAIGQPISHRLDHLLSGVRAQIALKIYGDDIDTLRGLADGLQGARVTQVIDGARRFDLVVRLADVDRSPQDLARVMLTSPAGQIPLSTVATVEEGDGPNQIGRENGRRRIVVYANTDGSNMSRIIEEVRKTVAGIATRNGILKVSHYINLCKFEGETFGWPMIVRGSIERLTPDHVRGQEGCQRALLDQVSVRPVTTPAATGLAPMAPYIKNEG